MGKSTAFYAVTEFQSCSGEVTFLALGYSEAKRSWMLSIYLSVVSCFTAEKH